MQRIRVSFRVATLLAAIAVQACLLWLYYHPQPKSLAGDEQLYLHVARELNAGRTVEPSLWPLFYGRCLAPLVAATGGSLWLVQLLQVALLAACALAVGDLTRRLGGTRTAGDLAVALMLIYPPLAAFAHYLWPEILHLALLLAALWMVVAHGRALAWMPVLGLSLGLALLTKNLLFPFLPVFVIAIARGDGWRRGLVRSAVMLAVLAAVLGPTLGANRAGSLTASSSAWFNTWVGLQDGSRRSLTDPVVYREYRRYVASAPDARQRDALLAEQVAGFVHRRGVLPVLGAQLRRQYFRLFDKDSYLTAQLPPSALAAEGQGYAGQPRPLTRGLRAASYALYALVLVLAAFGAVLATPRRHPGLWLVIAFLGYHLALFLVLHVKSRYRLPMMPFFFLYAAIAGDRLLRAWRSPRAAGGDRPIAAWQWSAGSALGALLLFLAFGAAWLDG